MVHQVKINLLGPVTVERDGEPVDGFKSRKVLVLLSYLAYQSQPNNRSRLAALLWIDKDESRGRANLSWALNNLNQLLPGIIQSDRDSVELHMESEETVCWVDTARFEELASQGDSTSLIAAAELYRGSFMDGVILDDCPEIDNWIAGNQQYWRQKILQVFSELIDYYVSRGDFIQGMHYATRLLAIEPWREDVHRRVMVMLARSGQRNAALAQLDTLKRILKEQFNIEPEEETLALYDDIREGRLLPGQEDLTTILQEHTAPAAQKGTTSNLTKFAQLPPFVGRMSELSQISEWLRNPECRLITVIGPGGIGKTRLAIQAAVGHSQDTFSEVFFIPLSNLSSPNSIFGAILAEIGIVTQENANGMEQLLHYIGRKRILFVLDNFEHLIDGAEIINRIAIQAPGVKFLITSREPLNLRTEMRLPLGGLPYPPLEATFSTSGTTGMLIAPDQPGRLWKMGDYSAAQLFVQSARRVKPDFSLDSDTEKNVIRICQLLEGMPLGIELAASWVRVMSCNQVAREIADNIDFLETNLRDVPARHRSMRGVFNHTWMLLNDAEQVVLRRLSIFPGRFTLEAAKAVSGATPAQMAALTDKSILRLTAAGHYDIHRAISQFAEEKLIQLPTERDEIYDRLSAYYAHFLHDLEPDLSGEHQKEALQKIAEAIENIRIGWDWGVKGHKYAELDMALEGIYRYSEIRSWYQESENFFAQAVQAIFEAKEEDLSDQGGIVLRNVLVGKLLSRQGALCGRMGLFGKAVDLLEDALVVLRQYNAEQEIAFGLNELGYVIFRFGDFDQARTLFEEALAIGKNHDDAYIRASTLTNLGLVAETLGEYEQAGEIYRESLALFEVLGDRHGISSVLNRMSDIARMRDQYEEAKQLIERGLEISRELGDRYREAFSLGTLGQANLALGDHEIAKDQYREAYEILRGLGSRKGMVFALRDLGVVSTQLQEYGQAHRRFADALKIAREIQAVSLGLETLAEIACLMIHEQAGEQLMVAELVCHVLEHPASTELAKRNARQVLAELEAELRPEKLKLAEAASREKSFYRYVGDTIEYLNQPLIGEDSI
ncbi:MAG: tetratricopeptide repeat protein [Anaerolineales bacterium]|nr:tetratricopeptide repeat protein [Anaerolineales bacterium]